MVLRSINARRAFIGCNGVDVGGGVTNVNLPETEIKRLVLDASQQRIVCADSSKLGQVALAHVCSLDETDLLITDDQGDPDLIANLRDTGLDVMVTATDG
jgi:DeoR family transcriptional regulator, aga operon transcriptional repressor